MSMYSLSEADGIGAQAPATQSRDWLRGAGIGILAVIGWFAFGLSCLIWEDLGDWSRTHELGIGAFVVAAVVLIGTFGAVRLGRIGAGLRQRASWLAGRSRTLPECGSTSRRCVHSA